MSHQDLQLADFNYRAPADLYSPRSPGSARPLVYRRFAFASEAVVFAIERLSPASLLATYLEVEDERYGVRDIQRLYAWHAELTLIGEVHVPN